MHFEQVKKADVPLLKKWFEQEYIAKHWYGKGLQNTYDSIEKFTNGDPCIYTPWLLDDIVQKVVQHTPRIATRVQFKN